VGLADALSAVEPRLGVTVDRFGAGSECVQPAIPTATTSAAPTMTGPTEKLLSIVEGFQRATTSVAGLARMWITNRSAAREFSRSTHVCCCHGNAKRELINEIDRDGQRN
jgi:hypothetical protein